MQNGWKLNEAVKLCHLSANLKLHRGFLWVVLISTGSYQHGQNSSTFESPRQAGTLIGCNLPPWKDRWGRYKVNRITRNLFVSLVPIFPPKNIMSDTYKGQHGPVYLCQFSFLDVRTWGLQRYIQAVTHTDNVEVQWVECASIQSSYSINKLRECKLITFSA